jgi:hypothetical protein
MGAYEIGRDVQELRQRNEQIEAHMFGSCSGCESLRASGTAAKARRVLTFSFILSSGCRKLRHAEEACSHEKTVQQCTRVSNADRELHKPRPNQSLQLWESRSLHFAAKAMADRVRAPTMLSARWLWKERRPWQRHKEFARSQEWLLAGNSLGA